VSLADVVANFKMLFFGQARIGGEMSNRNAGKLCKFGWQKFRAVRASFC
jgi:hypothetical protein